VGARNDREERDVGECAALLLFEDGAGWLLLGLGFGRGGDYFRTRSRYVA